MDSDSNSDDDSEGDGDNNSIGTLRPSSLANIFISQASEQSLAQAHYLYSSLTSQTSALLLAAGRGVPAGTGAGTASQTSGTSKAPSKGSGADCKATSPSADSQRSCSSPSSQQSGRQQKELKRQQQQQQQRVEQKQWSPNRPVSGLMQRKQAQFVVRHRELEREKALRLEQERLERRSQSISSSAVKAQTVIDSAQKLSSKANDDGFSSSSSSSSDENDGSARDEMRAIDIEARRDENRAHDLGDKDLGQEQEEEDEDEESQISVKRRKSSTEMKKSDRELSAIGSVDELMPMPSIALDLQWESQQASQSGGRHSLSSQNSIGSAGSEQRVPLRDASSCLDPAMHALRAQGADLDTGNGNFIMANRRRRSVHQVQLSQQIHQIHQQQQREQHLIQPQQQQHSQGSQQFPILKTQMTLASLHYPSSSMIRASGKRVSIGSQNRFSFKQQQHQQQRTQLISEEPNSDKQHDSEASEQIRSLRAATSIDESAIRTSEIFPEALSRPRFVSEPAKYFEEQQDRTDQLSGSFPIGLFGTSLTPTTSASSQRPTTSGAALLTATSSGPSKLDGSLERMDEAQELSTKTTTASSELRRDPSSLSNKESENIKDEDDDTEVVVVSDSTKRPADLTNNSQMVASLEISETLSPVQSPKFREYKLNDMTIYDLDELESPVGLLASLSEWNYPIFELHSAYGDSVLSKLSYRIFLDSGFFESK